MGVTNTRPGTNVHEVADGIFRLRTPVSMAGGPGGFSFSQHLIAGAEPLRFHPGPRTLFPLVREAVSRALPVRRRRYLALSHVEADACGALNDWLAVAAGAMPLCGNVAALVPVHDLAGRPPRALADGETRALGTHAVRWFDTPQLPHAWECGYLMEERTATLLCGDLCTQGGAGHPAVTGSDIPGPSEAFRRQLDYYSHTPSGRARLERLAAVGPRTLAGMHGSAWQGDGAALPRALAGAWSRQPRA